MATVREGKDGGRGGVGRRPFTTPVDKLFPVCPEGVFLDVSGGYP